MIRWQFPFSSLLSPRYAALSGLLLLSMASPCAAQDPAAPRRPTAGVGRLEKTLKGERALRARIDQFFSGVVTGDTAAAFAGLLKGSPLGVNQEEVGRLVESTEDILKTSGAIRSQELLRISRLGSRLIRFTYLSYSDDNPLRWEIYCYLGQTDWQILTLSVNNRIVELFDDPTTRRMGRPVSNPAGR